MNTPGWIIVLLTSSATAGVVFLIAGKIMQRHPPRWPNYFYGYRTVSSLQSKECFDAANVFSAALMVKYGAGLVLLGIVSSLFFNERYWWIFLSIGMMAVVGCLIALVAKTERYLSANFDKNGKSK